MRIFKIGLLFTLFLTLGMSVFGASYTTQRSGNWSDTTIAGPWWVIGSGVPNGRVPDHTNLDTVVVNYTTVTTTGTTKTAGATLLNITALISPIPSGTSMTFGAVTTTSTAAASVGDTTIPVTALTGSIASGVSALPFGHTLTVDTNQSFGNTSATFDLTIGLNSKPVSTLRIASGATLTLGAKVLQSGDLYIEPGGAITTTGTGPFRWVIYSDSTGRASDVTFAGTSGSHVSVKGSSSSSKLYFTESATLRNVNITYTDFQYGDTSATGIVPMYGGETTLNITNCTFDNCATPIFYTTAPTATHSATISGNIFTNSVGSDVISLKGGASYTSGNRILSGNAIDKRLATSANGFAYWNITGNILAYGAAGDSNIAPVVNSTIAAGRWTSFTNNFIKHTGASMICQGPMTDNIILSDAATNNDPNIIQLQNHTGAFSTGSGDIGAFSGNVYQSYHNGNNAALYYMETNWATVSATTIRCINNLSLPNINPAKPGSSGSVFNFTKSDANTTIYLNHNTANIDTGSGFQGAFVLGDLGGSSPAGSIASLRSNLSYGLTTPSTLNLLVGCLSIDKPDIVLPANCGYNGGYNLTTSTGTYNYNTALSKKGYKFGNTFGITCNSTVSSGTTISINTPGNALNNAGAVINFNGVIVTTTTPVLSSATSLTVASIGGTITSGTVGRIVMFTTAPSSETTDIYADPQFYDSTRDLSKAYTKYIPSTGGWGSNGNTAVSAVADYQALAVYLKNNVVAYPNIVRDLITQIRLGWRPTNKLYKKAGHDGQDTGALDGYYPSIVPQIWNIIRRRRVELNLDKNIFDDRRRARKVA
jgi:hypothetical protein